MNKRICFCPKSLTWIMKHLKKGARSQFRQMIQEGIFRKVGAPSLGTIGKRKKKRRTAKQRAATRRLIAFNKRRRR